MGRPDRVVAAAPYFNEADVVAIRLRELVGVVDAHVFCEAAWTYAGSPKPFGCLEAVFDALPAGEKVRPVVTWEGNGWRRVEFSTSLGEVVVVELYEEPPASFQDVYQGFGDRERWRRENYQPDEPAGQPVACGRGRIAAGVHGAAHKTLPCGTRIGVCLPDLSRCVEARIVDRGPYVAGRDLDLFGRTFAALAPLSVGVLPVVYRVHTVPRCVPAWVKTYRRAGNTVGRYAPTCGTAAAR